MDPARRQRLMPDELRDFVDDATILNEDVIYRAYPPGLVENWDSFSGSPEDISSRIWQDQKAEEAARWGITPVRVRRNRSATRPSQQYR